MHEFQKGHPDVQIHLEASDSIVSLVDGGFDLAIRFGPLLDSSLIARILAPDHRVICGAPTYLEPTWSSPNDRGFTFPRLHYLRFATPRPLDVR